MKKPILELQNLRKLYGAHAAVDDVSISLAEGEFLSLLGPSGSGKTTTLNMVAGLIEPTSGEIVLHGRPVSRLPPYRRNLGMVFQNYALFPHMTIARNIAFPLEMRAARRDEIDQRVTKTLALVGLPGHGNRYPKQLSGGQQQRVALARAMIFQPPLLLMDEPLGALDKKLREQLQLEIKQLHRQTGMSVLYVTHDQEEALTMSDRIAVFNSGKLEQVGTPAELYDEPATRFVAGFIGDTNLLSARVTHCAGGFCKAVAKELSARGRQAGMSVGESAVVSVRPERIRLSPMPPGGIPPENALAGTIKEIVFLGRSQKLIVRTAAADLHVFQQVGQDRNAIFEIGSTVLASWDAEHAVVLPNSGGE